MRLSLHVELLLVLRVVGLLAAVSGLCWSSRREEGSGGGQRRRSWRAAADSSPAVRGPSTCSRRRWAPEETDLVLDEPVSERKEN